MYRKYLFISLLFFFTCASAQEGLLPKLIQEQGIVGAAAAYSIEGVTKWSQAEGYANQEEKTPFTDTTLTRIASLAKPMTAIAIMQLVEQGKIDLHASVQTYLPDFPHPLITVSHLLAHTSGIDGYKSAKEAENKFEYPTLVQAMQVFQNRDLLFTPGSDFAYTSYGYVVLGVVIEKVSGQPYEDYMQQHIWDKADMRHTGIEKTAVQYDNKSLLYHTKKGKAKLRQPNNLSNRIPGGGFYSTLQDLIKFGNAVINHRLLKPETFATMIEVSFPQKEGNLYSYGWFLYGPSPNENAVIGHGGAQTGANTQIMIHPSAKIVVVLLANTSGTGNSVIKATVDLLQIAIAEVAEKDTQ